MVGRHYSRGKVASHGTTRRSQPQQRPPGRKSLSERTHDKQRRAAAPSQHSADHTGDWQSTALYNFDF